MAHGTDIFLSYKSEQGTWAERLQDDLERYGYTVFVDHDTAGRAQGRGTTGGPAREPYPAGRALFCALVGAASPSAATS